jgi:Putative transposase
VRVLSRVFRGKFVAGLKMLFRKNKLRFFGACKPLSNPKEFASFTRTLFRDEWVVYAKRPFGGPEHVLHYLARYTHRVAISNHRILNVTDTEVSFQWKDYKHRSQRRVITLSHEEFLRRFLQHVLPRGFPRIRYFGFLANRRRGLLLPLCRKLVGALCPPSSPANTAPTVHRCPRCHAPMRIIQRLTASELLYELARGVAAIDSS